MAGHADAVRVLLAAGAQFDALDGLLERRRAAEGG
jgi:hypothetical protein